MAVHSNNTRVKVTVPRDVLKLLRPIAKEQGCSISFLFLQAVIDKYLLPRAYKAQDPEPVKVPQEAPKLEPEAPKVKRKRIGMTPGAPIHPEVPKPGPKINTQVDKPVHIEYLIERFGGDRALKARLCQTGGRDGALFEGDLTRARKVAEVTAKLDPSGLKWFPLDTNRAYWLPYASPEEYARDILTKKAP